MFCTKCGAQMSEGQRFCSNCGAPMEQPPVEESKADRVAANDAYGQEELNGSLPEKKAKSRKTREKRPAGKAKGWVLGVLAVVALAAVALAVFRWNAVTAFSSNLFAKTFSDPEEYYQRVEKNNVRKYLDTAEAGNGFLSVYQETAAKRAAGKEAYVEEKLQFSFDESALSDEVLDLIEDEIGIDISWFRNLGMYVSVGAEDDRFGGTMTAFLNDTDIIAADYAYDNVKSILYLAVPTLSGQYMKIDPQEIMSQAGGAPMNRAAAEELTKLLSDEELVTTLIDRYSGIVINDLTKVEKGKQELKAGGLSTKYTALEVKIDGKVMLKIAKDVLKKVQNDAEVEKLVLAYFKGMGMNDETSAQYFDRFLKSVDEALGEVEDMDPEDIPYTILMTVFVDEQGRVRGRDVKIREDKDVVAELSYGLVTKGLNYGLHAELFMDQGWNGYKNEKTVVLDGDGKISLNKEITGSFDAHYKTYYGSEGDETKNDMKLFKINLEAAVKDKGFTYEITATPNKEMLNRLVEKIGTMPNGVEDLLRSLSLELSGEGKTGKMNSTMTVKASRKDLVSLSMDAYKVGEFDVRLPAEAVDPDEWAYGIDYSKLQGILSKLTEAGVPASVLGDIGDYI